MLAKNPLRKTILRKPIAVVCFLALAVFLVSAVPVSAEIDIGARYAENIGLGNRNPKDIIVGVIQVILGFLALLAVVLVMYAGFVMMTSQGDPKKIDTAKNILKNAIIGLLIVLSSWGIVLFLINMFEGVTRGGGGGGGGGGGFDGSDSGMGVLGNCAIESVYPAPGQRDVPRNTVIVVTFVEAVNPATVRTCTAPDQDDCVKIFRTRDPESIVTNVAATTTDERTYVFMPGEYLGSPNENVDYSVRLTNDIRLRGSNEGVFDDCRQDFAEWSFQVSTRLDLDPPQVKDVFPGPDNERDDVSVANAAVQAAGQIMVNRQPQPAAPGSADDPVPGGGSPGASVSGTYACLADGTISVTIQDGDPLRAAVSGVPGVASNDDASDGEAALGCGISLRPDTGSFEAGNSWTIDVRAARMADTLQVGSVIYRFVAVPAAQGQIGIGPDLGATVQNIEDALNTHQQVIAQATGASVTVTARIAGAAGNNIALLSSTNAFSVPASGHLEGGSDRIMDVTVNGRRDKPRNTAIQVNFNEPINPLNISGNAAAVSGVIRVLNSEGAGGDGSACTAGQDCLSYECNGGACRGNFIAGRFFISNQYATVEFLSDVVCGTNACGEQIYCLPENSNLRVELDAADLATCPPLDCAQRQDYNQCDANQHCINPATNRAYPMSSAALNGVMDMAINSLDGNRSGGAEGPVSYFNENNPDPADGDSFLWSFFINDQIMQAAPEIISLRQADSLGAEQDRGHGTFDADQANPVLIDFSQVMLSASLKSGQIRIPSGQDMVAHKFINLRGLSGQQPGYWIGKNNIDDSVPLDGEPDWTRGLLFHTRFGSSAAYRAQAGSGVKDIYQNCYRPSSGPNCAGSPSCCGEVPTAAGSCN